MDDTWCPLWAQISTSRPKWLFFEHDFQGYHKRAILIVETLKNDCDLTFFFFQKSHFEDQNDMFKIVAKLVTKI